MKWIESQKSFDQILIFLLGGFVMLGESYKLSSHQCPHQEIEAGGQ